MTTIDDKISDGNELPTTRLSKHPRLKKAYTILGNAVSIVALLGMIGVAGGLTIRTCYEMFPGEVEYAKVTEKSGYKEYDSMDGAPLGSVPIIYTGWQTNSVPHSILKQ